MLFSFFPLRWLFGLAISKRLRLWELIDRPKAAEQAKLWHWFGGTYIHDSNPQLESYSNGFAAPGLLHRHCLRQIYVQCVHIVERELSERPTRFVVVSFRRWPGIRTDELFFSRHAYNSINVITTMWQLPPTRACQPSSSTNGNGNNNNKRMRREQNVVERLYVLLRRF